MKETEKGRTKMDTIGAKANTSSGCFSWFPKRVRRHTRIRDGNEKKLMVLGLGYEMDYVE